MPVVRWIKCLHRRHSAPAPERAETPGQRAASSALVRAQSARREMEGMRPQVAAAAATLRAARQRNHFAEMIKMVFEGDRT
jgi:hypothetical protein